MLSDNKRIAVNTVIIYIRLFVVTIVSLISTRYVLQALGASDFGLFNVVASLLTMLNCISAGMHSTTRRYINVEMGISDGNMNRIFNVCLALHAMFAVFILVVCEGIGVWYVNHYLNVAPGKLADAHFVLQTSIIVSCLGILNVPYQALIQAFEKFWQIAVIDITTTVFKLLAVVFLVSYQGNALRLYAVIIGCMSLMSFVMYQWLCQNQWKGIVRLKWYSDKSLYKEIFVFNNYVALGAFGSLSKVQGVSVLINYFFNTIANAANAIATQIQTFVEMLVGNVASASSPQITQNYSSGNLKKSVDLCAMINRYVVLIMSMVFFPLLIGLDFILGIWLEDVPQYTVMFTTWILIGNLVSTHMSSLSTFIFATGKIKWFTIVSTVIDLLFLVASFILFYIGFPAYSIFICLTIDKLVNLVAAYILLVCIVHFDVWGFIRKAYLRTTVVIIIGVVAYLLLSNVPLHPLARIITMGLVLFLAITVVGLKKNERNKLSNLITAKFVR